MRASWVFRVLVDTHVWVGLGAGVQAWLGYEAAFPGPLTPSEQLYVGIAGLGAAAFYTLYRGWGRYLSAGRVELDWVFTLGIGMLAVAAGEARRLPPEYWFLLAVPATIAGVYAVARYSSGNARWFGLAKPLLLVAVWTWVVAYVPMARSGGLDVLLLGSRACFFLAIGIVSDYKDNEVDYRSGLRTVTRVVKPGAVHLSCLALMIASGGLALVSAGAIALCALSFATTSFIGLPVVWYAFRQNPGRWYYDFVVDGLLVLAGVLYLISQIIL